MQGGKTMGIFVLILQIILLAVVIFGGFSLLSRFVFNKVKINKWIILAATILFLWFLDILRNGYPKLKKEKKVVIKPKAKPNRVKHNKDSKK